MDDDGRFTLDGAEIRRRRLALEWSARDLAKVAGVWHDAIIDLEHNRRRPRKAMAHKIADALDCELGLLLREANDG